MLGTLDAVSVSGYRAACALLRILRRGDIVPVGLRASTGGFRYTGNPHGCRARSSGRVKSLFSPMFCKFAPHGD